METVRMHTMLAEVLSFECCSCKLVNNYSFANVHCQQCQQPKETNLIRNKRIVNRKLRQCIIMNILAKIFWKIVQVLEHTDDAERKWMLGTFKITITTTAAAQYVTIHAKALGVKWHFRFFFNMNSGSDSQNIISCICHMQKIIHP